MEIRLLTSEDMDRYVELIKLIYPDASMGVLEDRLAWFDLTQLQNKSIFLAILDNKIVGTASVLLEYKADKGSKQENDRLFMVAYLNDISVDPNQDAVSIKKHLVKYCIDFSKYAGAYQVITIVNDDDISSMENHGFAKSYTSMSLSL